MLGIIGDLPGFMDFPVSSCLSARYRDATLLFTVRDREAITNGDLLGFWA